MKFLYLQSSQAAPIIKDNRPKKEWPQDGTIRFDRYSVRYRPGLDLVLKDLSFTAEKSEKVKIFIFQRMVSALEMWVNGQGIEIVTEV